MRENTLLPCNYTRETHNTEKWITTHKNFISVYTKETYRCKSGKNFSRIERKFFINGVLISVTEPKKIPEHAEPLC